MWIRSAVSLCMVLAAGCSGRDDAATTLTLATTTSTRDSGLLDVLLPKFEKETGIEVKVVAVGSGQALELGRRGDADVLLTHAPEAEERFVAAGHGVERQAVMHNDFVIVGPEADPAHVQRELSIAEAFRRMARSEAPFVSRGDDSGTHMKEKRIWQEAGAEPQGDWYIRAGAGMAEALRMASQLRAYTLSDRGTFLAQRNGLALVILFEGDRLLENRYSAIVVNPERHPHVHQAGARRFIEFLVSPEVQRTIAEYGVSESGEPLFFPRRNAE